MRGGLGTCTSLPLAGIFHPGEHSIQLPGNPGLRTEVSCCLSPRAGSPIDERRDTTWALPVLKLTRDPVLKAAQVTRGGARTIPSPTAPSELNTHK